MNRKEIKIKKFALRDAAFLLLFSPSHEDYAIIIAFQEVCGHEDCYLFVSNSVKRLNTSNLTFWGNRSLAGLKT